MTLDDGQLHCPRCKSIVQAGASVCGFCGCSLGDTDFSVANDPPTWQERCYLACAVLLMLQGAGLIVVGAVALKGQLLVYLALGGLFAIATGVGLLRFELWAHASVRVLGVLTIMGAFRMGVMSGLNLGTYPYGPVVFGVSVAVLAFWVFLIWLTFAVSDG